MKKAIISMLAVISSLLILSGCQKALPEAERPWPETVTYSNLSDENSRTIAKNLLSEITDEKQIQMFFDHVDQINHFLQPEELTDGFEKVNISQPKYDPYDIQARWEEEYPDFLGYNCRITAFSLFKDLINVKQGPAENTDYITMDLYTLESDPAALSDETGLEQFQNLYSGIATENTRDISTHLKHLKKSWQDRDISFNNSSASLISVVFHDQIDGDQLFIGHTGILFEDSNEELYFLEKIAFQEPYQLVKIADRSALSDYLMVKYDVGFDQSTASPFILENDSLIEGYRNHSNQ